MIYFGEGHLSLSLQYVRFVGTATMPAGRKIELEFVALYDAAKAEHLARFFKTAAGEYGEGDKFLGITVPVTRAVVRKYRSEAGLDDIEYLINSEWHEIRLAGFLLLIEIYKNTLKHVCRYEAEQIVQFYLDNLNKGNNWDLVDLVAPKILGDWLVENRKGRGILEQLSANENGLWHNRVAIVSTLALIKVGEFDDTFRIAKRYLKHSHDLIHKATGWMLREAGKRGGEARLREFLDEYASVMPRTMLRYSIEKFTREARQHYMSLR